MTAPQRLEHDLPQLLAQLAGGTRPDYRDSLVEAVGRTRQRPAWTFPGRWLPMDLATERLVPQTAFRIPVTLLIVVALVVAAVVALAVAARPELPAPYGPARNGIIVYALNGDLYAVEPGGTAPRVIVGGAAADESPLFSPQGDQFRFIRITPQGSEVWLADADGMNTRRLTDPLVGLSAAAWSPDGRSIALAWDDGGNPVVGIAATDGSGIREVEVGMPAYAPSWRPPGGDQLVVRGQHDGTYDLYLVDAATLAVSRMALGDADGPMKDYEKFLPQWSPDGSQLVFQRHETLRGASGGLAIRMHLIDVDAAGTVVRDTMLEHDGASDFEYFGRWLADGRFAFATQTGCKFEVFVGRLPRLREATSVAASDDCANVGIDYELSPDASEVLYWLDSPTATVWRTRASGGDASEFLPAQVLLGQVTWQRLAP